MNGALRADATRAPNNFVPQLTLSDYVCIENRPFKYLLQYTTLHFFYLHKLKLKFHIYTYSTLLVLYIELYYLLNSKQKLAQSDYTLWNKVFYVQFPLTVKPIPPFGGRFAVNFFKHCTKTSHTLISYQRRYFFYTFFCLLK